jgi:NAD(P)-dependent dehydrogenase (short-subunit alcohol dehydrogenase family)
VKELNERVVVITGASAGIGRGLAQAFADQGAHLVLADLDAEGLEATRDQLPERTPAVLVPTDVSRPDALEELAERAFDVCGEVHVLCNNAGVACSGLVWEQSLEDWDWLLRVNVMGIVHGIRSFVPRMLAQASPAHIVNTASMMGLLTSPGIGAYAATKHAAVAVSETLRHDLAGRGSSIGVSVLCPGPVDTRVHEERYRPSHSRKADAQRPERVARMAAMKELLASGMSPRTVGDRVVEAVREDRFYVFSHPDYVAGIEPRYREIRGQMS